MRKMNCRNVRREIEEVAPGDLLSSSANDHVKNCAQCGTFREERLKLREMLSSLGAVEAPGDFDFRLRARLANEKRGGGQPFVMRNLSFGFRSAAVATMLLLIGSALLIVSLRTPRNAPLVAKEANTPSATIDQPSKDAKQADGTKRDTAANIPKTEGTAMTGGKSNSSDPREKVAVIRHDGFKRREVAADAGNGRLKTRDQGSTEARVLRKDALDATGSTVFPIGTSFQSLKVSLDDGRGSSRTISLPSVSFGSQRVLAQGSSPFLASARSDW